jgi:hypothetical protein
VRNRERDRKEERENKKKGKRRENVDAGYKTGAPISLLNAATAPIQRQGRREHARER